MPFWDRWRGRRAKPDPRAALAAFLQADDWPGSRRVIERHPELLAPEADALLREFAAAEPGEPERATLEEHRALLARCRTAGIAQAFAEKIHGAEGAPRVAPDVLLQLLHASAVGDEEEERRLLAQHPELNVKSAGPGQPPANDAPSS